MNKQSWQELTKKQKITRIFLIFSVVIFAFAIISGIGNDESSSDDNIDTPSVETGGDNNSNSNHIFEDYPEIDSVLLRYNELASVNLTKNDYVDKTSYSKDYITISTNGFYIEYYHNSTGTWIEFCESINQNPTENDFENQFVLLARSLNASLTESNARNIWNIIKTNEYSSYSPYKAHGMKCSSFSTADSLYNVVIAID